MRVLAFIILALAASACTLNTSREDIPPTNAVLPATATSRPASPTNAPAPTNAPTNTPRAQTVSTTCTPRADWTTSYTIVSGDTLASIARRTGSTVSELSTGNCITDANLISVGQRLRVPRSPTSNTLPPTQVPNTTTGLQQMGTININPYLWADAGNYVLTTGQPTTLRWDGGPSTFGHVEFYVFPPTWFPGQGGVNGLYAGQDLTADGSATVSWVVPSGLTGALFAVAYRADGTLQAYSYPQYVSSDQPQQGLQVYSNTTLGIAFSYPAGGSVNEYANMIDVYSPTGEVIFELGYGEYNVITQVDVAARDFKSAGAGIDNRPILSEGQIVLPSGMDGYRIDMGPDPVDNQPNINSAMTFFIVNNRNLYPRSGGSVDAFNAILNTLRWLQT